MVGFEVVAGFGVVVAGFCVVVGTTTGGRLDLVKVAVNPVELCELSDLKRTTIVLPVDSTGFGIFPPQNLPSDEPLVPSPS